MKLIPLGISGGYPRKDTACSSYLIKSDKNIVLDLGAGALLNLTKHIKINDIDAIFLSHFHSDHINDLFVLRYALRMNEKITIYMQNLDNEFANLIRAYSCFDIRYISVGDIVQMGKTKVRVVPAIHAVPTVGFVVENNGKSLYYTADTKMIDEVKNNAKLADLVIADTFMTSMNIGEAPHMSSKDVSNLALSINGRVLATHIHPLAVKSIGEELRNVEIAEQNKEYIV